MMLRLGYPRSRAVVMEREVIVERPVVIGQDYEVVGVDRLEGALDGRLVVELERERFVLDEGQFFRIAQEGIVWVKTPVGALIPELPIGADTIWYQDDEYFEFDQAYFLRCPEGFKVVVAPWLEEAGDAGGIE
ncbi:MAG: hypothetical protein J6386_03035 [Candidatus Synoicihabitans palmerolidicus]|nr:hypothetical protein [Candidatus Synoicihabitans palmerolidicus]